MVLQSDIKELKESLAKIQAAVEKKTMNRALELIAKERERQMSKEGWTADHDDKHDDQELACAAACYVMPDWGRALRDDAGAPLAWPFDDSWWKPSPGDRIRDLVKAGALIVAEIERLQRKKTPLPDKVKLRPMSEAKDYCQKTGRLVHVWFDVRGLPITGYHNGTGWDIPGLLNIDGAVGWLEIPQVVAP